MEYLKKLSHKIKIKKRNLEILISVISLIVSAISLFVSGYVAMSNLNLSTENSRLTNYTPSIFSNYTYSTLKNTAYMRNESFVPVGGLVTMDLTVLTPHYGKMTIELRTLNYSEPSFSTWLDLEKQQSVSYSDRTVYECFVEQGMNRVVADFVFSELIIVKPYSVSPDNRFFGFKLGALVLEAKFTDLQNNQTITQEFQEGLYLEVNVVG